ncbi:T-complex-associated testis-expressed protein 1 isoform X2 [Eurytemora carolleeae]|uniref:T-complex-associated testis-expressed protein 1 isoform X2 n=1 Tax=Eurytemora carolleeae TaxID=1294199 RepID=UPI000C788FEE|nr:T-complex-associated testis-expressed protein 1 isoform X2 [Eurytemora carolleeae]|eukprot:XP_023339532.1 T-complex-associated testis-expressed protein 1-like isoform X2 [Eurytemora affinis]
MVVVRSEILEAYLPSTQEVKNELIGEVVSENIDWNLKKSVPSLYQSCIQCLTNCFSRKPWLSRMLKGKHRQRFLEEVDECEDLSLVYQYIEDTPTYWSVDVSMHSGSWKQLCVERALTNQIEAFQPLQSSYDDIKSLCQDVGSIVKYLRITQLLPPEVTTSNQTVVQSKGEVEVESTQSKEVLSRTPSLISFDQSNISSPPRVPTPVQILDMDIPPNHLDFSLLLPLIPNLEELHICCQVKKCGLEFRWSMFGLTEKDADNIGTGLEQINKIKLISIKNSKVSDSILYMVLDGLEKMKLITVLDFPNNIITDESIEPLVKFITGKNVRTLNLSNNRLRNEGATHFAIFLSSGKSSLTSLNFNLNLIQDEGGISLLKALSVEKKIIKFCLASNRLTSNTGHAIRDLLKLNRTIEHLEFSCNRFEGDTGDYILEGIKSNTSIKFMDLRLSGIGQEEEAEISAIIRKNVGV